MSGAVQGDEIMRFGGRSCTAMNIRHGAVGSEKGSEGKGKAKQQMGGKYLLW